MDHLIHKSKIFSIIYLFIACILADQICPFTPFQVIPYNNDSVTIFSHDVQVYGCFLENAWVKFSHEGVEIEQQWLTADYMDISVSSNKLYFKVRKFTSYLKCICFIRIHQDWRRRNEMKSGG